jgi:hypothetical protein
LGSRLSAGGAETTCVELGEPPLSRHARELYAKITVSAIFGGFLRVRLINRRSAGTSVEEPVLRPTKLERVILEIDGPLRSSAAERMRG